MRTFALVVLGAVGIAAGAWITVPLESIPMTLQTLSVVLVGAHSRRVGLLAVSLYLVLALLGLPVLAGFRSAPGAELFELASSGYLIGFLPGAWLAARMRRQQRWWHQLAWAVAAHVAIMACGVLRLSLRTGFATAFDKGFQPFVAGALVKSALAVLLLAALRRWAVGGAGGAPGAVAKGR